MSTLNLFVNWGIVIVTPIWFCLMTYILCYAARRWWDELIAKSVERYHREQMEERIQGDDPKPVGMEVDSIEEWDVR